MECTKSWSFRVVLAGLALVLLTSGAAHAVEIPALTGRVVDRADLLPPDRERLLEGRLGRFEQEKGTQVVVHTTPSLEGADIDTYSYRVARAWRIGRKGLDDGVILTVAPNERKVRIEVGFGLEDAISDDAAGRIIQEEILPDFRAGRFVDGIERGVESILRSAAAARLPAPTQPRPGAQSGIDGWMGSGRDRSTLLIWGGVLLVLLAFAVILGARGGHGGLGGWRDYDCDHGYRYRYGLGFGSHGHSGLGSSGSGLFGGGGGGGGGSSSSTSGSSGGGGRFRGAGASGSW